MFSKAFLKLYIQMCVGTIYVWMLVVFQVKYTIIYSCTLMYMCSFVIHFAFAHVQINTWGRWIPKSKAKFSILFGFLWGPVWPPVWLPADVSPQFKRDDLFLCVSGSAHRDLVFTLVSPFGFSVSQRWFVRRSWPRWPWHKSWRHDDRITRRKPSHQ